MTSPHAMPAMDNLADRRVAGVDGCRGGWLVVTTGVSASSATTIEVHPDLATVAHRVRIGELAAVGLDMPIGLSANGARTADAAARALLGARRSSLFPTPPRAVLDATTFEAALASCRAASGKGLSIQAFNLLPAMRDVAAHITPGMQPTVSEVHPETSFAVLRGAPCAYPKKVALGRQERGDALRPHFGNVDALLAEPRRGANVDDVLDAMVAAWTARRMADNRARILGDAAARDERGYRLTITA